MRAFDYAFFSIYNLYLEKEGKASNTVLNTTFVINTFKLFMFFGFVIFFLHFTPKNFSLSDYLGITSNIGKLIFVSFIIIWTYFSYISYKKRLPVIQKKYRNHPRNKWFKPWMLYFVALGFILIPILIVKSLKAFV